MSNVEDTAENANGSLQATTRTPLFLSLLASAIVLGLGELEAANLLRIGTFGRSRDKAAAATVSGPRYSADHFRAFAAEDFSWRRRHADAGELELAIRGCTRPSREEALEGLRDSHLLFMGDSMMRYQYLNLAYFLETGRPFHPGAPHNEMAHEWNSAGSVADHWVSFFQGTSERLKTEICDCWRPGLENGVEMRFYFGARGVRLTYVQFFAQEFPHQPGRLNVPVAGHNLTAIGINAACARRRTCKMDPALCSAPGQCKAAPHWAEDDSIEAISTVSRVYRPDLLLLNTHLWASWDHPFSLVYHEVLRAALSAAALEMPAMAQVWKSGTQTRKLFVESAGKRSASIDRGIQDVLLDFRARENGNAGFLDADSLLSSIGPDIGADEVFADHVHLRPGMNDAVNFLFLCAILPVEQRNSSRDT